MASIWNADGSTQQQRGTGRGWGGGAQTHSIFGWADEKVEVVVSETRSQGMRGSAPSADENRPAAGFKAAGKEDGPTERKVNEAKLKDIQGHNIFDNGEAPAPDGHVNEKRIKEMQGSNIFELGNEALAKKEVSQYKSRELQGNSGILGDASTGMAENGAKSPYSGVRVSQPAGGRSSISFG